MNWKKLVGFLALSAISTTALAESKWQFVTDVRYGKGGGNFIAQIDTNSIKFEGNAVFYWLRVVKLDLSSPSLTITTHAGPSLYQDECALNRFRVVQGTIIWGYDGPSIPLSRPAEWQFVAPDSLAESAHKFVCAKRKIYRKRRH